MRKRVATFALAGALLIAASAIAGCGSSGSDETTQGPAPAASSDSAFPTNGTTTGPNVTTTAGKPAAKSKGEAGGGSSATCIGC